MNNAFTALLVAFPAYLLYRGKLTDYLKFAGGKINAGATSTAGSQGMQTADSNALSAVKSAAGSDSAGTDVSASSETSVPQ